MYSKTAYLAIILAGTAVALPSPPVSPPSVPTIPANGPTYAPVQNYLCEQVEKDETKITCSKQAEWIPTIDYTDHHKAQTRSIYSRGEKPKPLCYKFSDDEKDRVKTK
jgi:UDP:flavonoid glycosyltransferase YjiC (YdhE family)